MNGAKLRGFWDVGASPMDCGGRVPPRRDGDTASEGCGASPDQGMSLAAEVAGASSIERHNDVRAEALAPLFERWGHPRADDASPPAAMPPSPVTGV